MDLPQTSTSRTPTLMASSGTKNFIKLLISFIILLSFSIFILNNDKQLRLRLLRSISSGSDTVEFFCSETQDPNYCITSISSSELAPNSFQELSPDEFLRISLKVAIQNLTRVISLAERLPLITSINGAESALSTCRDTFRDSMTYLIRSLTTLGKDSQTLTSEKKKDIMKWLDKSDSGLLMCVDLLDYSGQAVSDLSLKVYRARTLANNIYYFLLTKHSI